MRLALLGLAILLLPAAVSAQALGERDARAQLFPARGVSLAVSRSLDERQRAIMSAMVDEAERTGQDFLYYGSIAFSPDEGLQSEALQGAFNFHDTASSDAAALAACNAARRPGARPCEIAAQIRPRGYEPRPLQLSYDATNAFRSTYRRIRGEKAFATSSRTGAWAMAEGDEAAATAVAECNRRAEAIGGRADCAAVIVD